MSVKNIKEIESGICEISVAESENDRGQGSDESSWIEADFESEDDRKSVEEDDKEFSIGDTMLARGEKREKWDSESLEDAVDWGEVESFGDEDFGGESFSYEVMRSDSGDNIYGGGNFGVEDIYRIVNGDIYGAPDGLSDRNAYSGANVYDIGGNSKGEVKMYGENRTKIKTQEQVESERRVNRSGLEMGLRGRKSGVSRVGMR